MSQPLETGLDESRSLHFGIAHRVAAAAEQPLWNGAVLAVVFGGVECADGTARWGWHCAIRVPDGTMGPQFGLVLDLAWTSLAGWGASRRCGFLDGDPCACLLVDARRWDEAPPQRNASAFAEHLRDIIEQVSQLRRFWERVGDRIQRDGLGRWPGWERLEERGLR